MSTPKADYLRALRAKAVAQGKCSMCRCRPALPGLRSCADCLQRQKDAKAKNVARGLCHCGRERFSRRHKQCAICIERGANQSAARRLAAHERGDCDHCFHRPHRPDRRTCTACGERAAARGRAYYASTRTA